MLYLFNNSQQLDTQVLITKRKKTFPPASRYTIENCLPRYELAAKKASKITDFNRPSATLLRKRKALVQVDLLQSNVDFVLSETSTTPGAGYNSLHYWLGRTFPPAKLTPCKFKLRKISRKIYEKNSGFKVADSHIALTSSSTSKKKGKTIKEDLDNNLRSYYKSVPKQDILSSQTYFSPDRSNLSKIDTPITIATHAQNVLQGDQLQEYYFR